jgi:hypothetical protein
MERYKTIHENKVMINPPEEHKPGSSYTEHELGEKPKEWKRVILPIKPSQPQPQARPKQNTSNNPLTWNWTAIIVWSILLYIAYNIFRGLYHLIN